MSENGTYQANITPPLYPLSELHKARLLWSIHLTALVIRFYVLFNVQVVIERRILKHGQVSIVHKSSGVGAGERSIA
ncbi:hypothetical protein CEXT_602141 [Caerostris extrusa]|uniref:Uncharacterized protein n=1 Tax=Caerostris extrusa TaxID=172846 RepID=A0AAV4QQ04_CAEEX|nr:hypothetical protein CEXT_602141 [Caerostris extrusa]